MDGIITSHQEHEEFCEISIMNFVPQNELEESLWKAVNEPEHRPQFYRDLVAGTLFIIHHGVTVPQGHDRREMQPGEQIQIMQLEANGKYYIPVFTDLIRMQPVISGEVAYLGMNAMELFTLTRGADLLLNPGSEFCKELSVAEISEMIDGTIGKPLDRREADTEIKVEIGELENQPTELLATLKKLFARDKRVKKAWIARFLDPRLDEKQHTLLAIEVTKDYEAVMADIGVVVDGIDIPEPPLDILQIKGNGGVEEFFLNSSKPFYVRKKFGLF